jgi:hypothetical protein
MGSTIRVLVAAVLIATHVVVAAPSTDRSLGIDIGRLLSISESVSQPRDLNANVDMK